MLTSISKIQRHTAGLSYEDLMQDERTLDAIVHNLQIIGEATKQIPDSLRSKYPQIQWKAIAGMRDIIAHAYFSINTRIVWNVIQQELKPLKDCIEQLQQNENLDP
ncbi:MAG: DUF86 domain-containing protein [Leptolyngbyaceae cyanobacterium SM1_1_3]|nr:DUF86 domain-containing protein [Leptolyngbyaceae cyanobacterium SM1_1_3]NJN03839.1 DUF86 domain-containing protein [Leptolyngbyaceae cyanobacterium RM1_1_2]NJO10029.1 DUF86 domain-containing protein [Leptolyngbyaceae cyanobacterium SL_1_1]